MFTPQFINATKGSVITFMFAAANHSVAESSFATPCEPLANGFNSGFVPFTDEPGVWNLTVTDDATRKHLPCLSSPKHFIYRSYQRQLSGSIAHSKPRHRPTVRQAWLGTSPNGTC